MRSRFERGACGVDVIGGRAGDIDKIRRLARQQQVEIFVDADIFDCAQRSLTPLGDRFVDRDDSDLGPLAPSGQMALFGDLAEPGDGAAQLQAGSLASGRVLAAWDRLSSLSMRFVFTAVSTSLAAPGRSK